jgi:hypothetical protein
MIHLLTDQPLILLGVVLALGGSVGATKVRGEPDLRNWYGEPAKATRTEFYRQAKLMNSISCVPSLIPSRFLIASGDATDGERLISSKPSDRTPRWLTT